MRVGKCSQVLLPRYILQRFSKANLWRAAALVSYLAFLLPFRLLASLGLPSFGVQSSAHQKVSSFFPFEHVWEDRMEAQSQLCFCGHLPRHGYPRVCGDVLSRVVRHVPSHVCIAGGTQRLETSWYHVLTVRPCIRKVELCEASREKHPTKCVLSGF